MSSKSIFSPFQKYCHNSLWKAVVGVVIAVTLYFGGKMAFKSLAPIKRGRIIALDINGTIVSGDSTRGAKDTGTIELTSAAKKLFERLQDDADVRIVLYTFGPDWPKVIKEISARYPEIQFPRKNRRFVGRTTCGNVLTMPLDAGKKHGGSGKKYGIDFDAKKMSWEQTEDEHLNNFDSLDAFGSWIDSTTGHMVLRANYTPSSKFYDGKKYHIVGRKSQTEKLHCKVIASRTHDIYAFDDHNEDWTISNSGIVSECANFVLTEPGFEFFKQWEVKDAAKYNKQFRDRVESIKDQARKHDISEETYLSDIFNIELDPSASAGTRTKVHYSAPLLGVYVAARIGATKYMVAWISILLLMVLMYVLLPSRENEEFSDDDVHPAENMV